MSLARFLFAVAPVVLGLMGPAARSDTPGSATALWKTDWRYSAVADVGTAPDRWLDTRVPCVFLDPKQAGAVWFSARLPERIAGSPTLYIRAMDRPFQVYLGGQNVYQFGFEAGRPNPRFLGFPWHRVQLPAAVAGQKLRFLTTVTNTKSGFCSEIYVGSSEGLTAKLATDGLDRALGALFALLCGIAGIAVIAATKTWRPYLAFSGYSFSIAAWVFSNTSGPASKLFLIDSPRFWALLDLGGLYLTPVFLAAFFRQIAIGQSLGLRALQVIQWGHLAFAAVVLPLGAIDVINLGQTLRPYNQVIPIFLLVLTIESARRLRSGKREERIFAAGIAVFLLFGIHDFLVGKGILTWTRHLAHWGHVGILASLTSIVVLFLRRQITERAEFQRRSEINARATEKARGAFHDIKTQIASIGSKIDGLAAVPQDAKDNMKANLARMRTILSIQFEDAPADPATAKAAANLEPAASIGGTLSVLEEDFAQIARGQGVTLDVSVPKWAYRTFVPMRAADLHRIVANLTDNAVHAAAMRARRVFVSVERADGRAQLVVRDFGPGFSEAALSAFERDEAFSSKTDGTGRGLRSARSLAEGAKSTLRVLSEATGAAVTVDLLICEMPSWYFDAHSAQLDEVLVLDDDEEIGVKLQRALPGTAFRTFMEEAPFLDAARSSPGAFLFVDYGFAGKRTGLDLIKVAGLAERAVLFTGRAHFDVDVQARAVAAGVRILPKECVNLRAPATGWQGEREPIEAVGLQSSPLPGESTEAADSIGRSL